MSITLISILLVAYFGILLWMGYITSGKGDEEAFFSGNKQSPWYLVAFGMIGTSLSGVTFISVPGKVGVAQFAYFQLVLGYLAGYLVVAGLLMPLYYRLNVVSIYSYLEQRLGWWSYKTGSTLFLVSRTVGSSLRLFIAADVLQTFLFNRIGIPFIVTVAITILLIWLYTFKGGIKTIVWTDTFQTFFLVSAVIISVVVIGWELNWGALELFEQVQKSSYSSIFFWDDPLAKNYFWKQFISGMFITIVMTGLDQDLMQKNLSCKNISEAKKNMYWFSFVLVVINFLFLTLGALLFLFATTKGIEIPKNTDQLYPILALNHLGSVVGVFFLLGIIASSYASSDSALAALTTSFCIDFLQMDKKEYKNKTRHRTYVHIGFSILFFLIIVFVHFFLRTQTLIDTVLGAAAYTYGPLLGLFAFGIFTDKKIVDRWVPLVCIVPPILTYYIQANSTVLLWGYTFAFEHILINAGLTFIGLWMIKKE
ncbi:MAG: sodium:solute symporter [Cytophagaceae bacterium]|jgi:SSS family transporter|nr:sodium:solute symporter [Cytophagaceae bacterium]